VADPQLPQLTVRVAVVSAFRERPVKEATPLLAELVRVPLRVPEPELFDKVIESVLEVRTVPRASFISTETEKVCPTV
jgi:hypothetical protein